MKSFAVLLDALMEAPESERVVIEKQIHDAHLRRKAVLALDMSGFTQSVRRDGILSYLCQIRRMQKLTLPILHAHEGELVKFEADNLLAIFDDPVQAVEAALAIHRLASHLGESGLALSFSIGIDHGDLLLISGTDCFGECVNLAHKLGEDIADPGELLVTDRVRQSLANDPRFELREIKLSISSVDLVAYHVTQACPTQYT